MDWNSGYHTDTTYTYGYYGEINPIAMRFLLLASGVTPPDVSTACELGYGQGVSINIHAAAEPIAWYGTDFNPAQVSFAQQMAKISGARCYGDSFEDLLSRHDLPELDYVALHGIWSWVAPHVRRAILNVIDKKLRPGGVLYISYNTYPGWGAFQPVRNLMKLYLDASGHGNSDAQARAAFAFAQKLVDLDAAYITRNSEVKSRIADFSTKDASYLNHEFFNEVWHLESFADMAAALAEARMTFACSAQPLFVISGAGLTSQQSEFLGAIDDPVLRETTLDFIRNTQFRKDYFIKGRRPISSSERMAALREQAIVLTVPSGKLEKEVKIASGSAKLSDAAHHVLTSVLADGRSHTLADLEKAAQELASRPNAPEGAAKENFNTLLQSVLILMSGNLAAPAQIKADVSKARLKTDKLNAFIESRAVDNGQIAFLASPVTGGGISVGRFEQLFLLAYARGAKTSDVMGNLACNALLSVGQRMQENGEALEPEAMKSKMQTLAADFLTERIPVLKNLQII